VAWPAKNGTLLPEVICDGGDVKKILFAVLACLGLLSQALADSGQDPHYTEVGFFDIHICNWPDRPPFIMALFSTVLFDNVAQVSVYTPTGELIGNLNLARFRAFKNKEGKDKRAFITQFRLPDKTTDGWYKAIITMKDGRSFEAKDYVIRTLMPLPTGMQPAADAKDVPLPGELHWNPVPGAYFYQVYVYDKWNDTLVFKSPVIKDTFIKLPPGTLQSGGLYGWTVNARDVNEHVLLGDFNDGTVSAEYQFTTR
jgi:hypothetical protein